LLLGLVLIFGVGNSADRWLDLYFIRFQPSELMKILVPLMVATFYSDKPLPPRISYIFVAILIVLVPVFMIMRQPDLGTALLIGMSGAIAILLAGMSLKFFLGGVISAASLIPILWLNMHQYQKQRVLTFFNPESDPLGSGYHLMQSKIALGSGGFFGKGFFNGTQSKLGFVPEHSTDFIFTAFGEEFGYLGVIILMSLYLFIALRGLSISIRATDNFGRILTGTLSLTIFLYVLVNVGMVIGFLPVVGAPLPFMSYGGTSMVTLFATIGMIMSIKSHQRILRK
jgi:rod shape determining protein RodA